MRSKNEQNNAFKASRYTARWPMRHASLPENYRRQTVTKSKHSRWWKVFADMCRMGRW